ncbi:hypothetical protein BGZ79_006149 [Entomortierella chlamydospora]|nr:hypothetical protein BGZ79_006149 [Entomortierella chlamydospora]
MTDRTRNAYPFEFQASADDLKGVTLLSSASAAKEVGPTKVKRLALISSEDLKTPTIAIPTIAVAAGSLAVWGSILYYGAHKRKVSSILTFPIMTAACFAVFTPIHDGTHYSIAKGPYKKVINNLVGNLSGIPLNLPFGVYRQLHLLHHRYTNTEKDPDIWDSQGNMVLRAVKWFFPDYFWIKAVLSGEVKNAKIIQAALYYLGMIFMMKKMNDKGMAFVKYWLIPQRAMTSVTGGILRSDGFNLAIPLLNQHLHNIHHLYPQLPFTHYGRIWAKHKDALIAGGTEIHPVYSAKQGWRWDERMDGTRK